MSEKILPCPTCGVDVMAIRTAPVYYLLRRTVGKTTMHYEYWCIDGRFWSDEPYPWGCTFDKQDAELYKNYYGGEIIPVKLMEAPHES